MIESLRLIVSLYSLKCQCFTGETLVSTTEGDKRIDEIKVGYYVYTYDTETGEKIASKVTYVSVTKTDIIVHVYTSEGEEIKTTMLHPFYVKNVKDGEEKYGVWKAASNLVYGDELLTEDGRIVYVESVEIERLDEDILVYNLEVEGLHTYYVGNGILVHNEYGNQNLNANLNEKLEKIKELMAQGKKSPDGRRIIYQLDDITKIIFGLDIGDNAHALGKYGYPEAVDHMNIEIQTVSKSGNTYTKWDMHLILNALNEVIDVIITGAWKEK